MEFVESDKNLIRIFKISWKSPPDYLRNLGSLWNLSTWNLGSLEPIFKRSTNSIHCFPGGWSRERRRETCGRVGYDRTSWRHQVYASPEKYRLTTIVPSVLVQTTRYYETARGNIRRIVGSLSQFRLLFVERSVVSWFRDVFSERDVVTDDENNVIRLSDVRGLRCI